MSKKIQKGPAKVFGVTIGGKKGAKQPEAEAIPVLSLEDKQAFVYNPVLPKVNVLPSSVTEKYQIKGIVRKFAVAGAGIATVLGLAFLGGTLFTASVQAEIDDLTTQQATLTAESALLQPYQTYNMAIDAKRKGLSATTSEDVNMGTLYGHVIESAASNNVEVGSLTVAQYKAGEEGTACINPDPFGSNEGIIGCVTIEGAAFNKDEVNGFLTTLEALNGIENSYKDPFISSFTTAAGGTSDGPPSSFSATISFTSALYTQKYSSLSRTLEELIAAAAPVDSSEADVTDETAAEDIEEVALPPAGTTATFAATLVTGLTPEDGRSLDGIAYNTCSTGDESTTAETISSLLSASYPDVNTETVVPQILTTITENCEVIIAEQEGNN